MGPMPLLQAAAPAVISPFLVMAWIDGSGPLEAPPGATIAADSSRAPPSSSIVLPA